MNKNKKELYDFQDTSSCGEALYLKEVSISGYKAQSSSRYKLEVDLIFPFAEFKKYTNKKVLEIGVGLGSDHQQFSQNGADLFGIDLTENAINHTKRRLSLVTIISSSPKFF